MWSLSTLSLARYYVTFAVLFVLVTVLYLWRGFATAPPGTHIVDTTLAALKEASSLTLWLIVFTYYLVEGFSMLAERYLRSRYAKGKEEGLKEGRQEGREEAQQQWLAWNQRREEALRQGKEFTELPPGESENVNK